MSNLSNYSNEYWNFDIYKDYLDTLDIMSQQQEGNPNMEKKYMVTRSRDLTYKTYEEAEKVAKQNVAKYHEDYAVLQATAVAVNPTPAVEIVKL